MLGLTLAGALAWPLAGGGTSGTGGVSGLLPTPAWGRPGRLFLRSEGAAGGLLLRRDDAAVYRYDPKQSRLGAADVSAWDQAGGALADCASQIPATAIRIDTASGRAVLDGRTLPAAGAQVVTTLRSPSTRLAVLLSAGAARPSLLPALGAGHQAPFFHQVFALTDSRQLSPSVRLPFGGSSAGLSACWSADEQFVVYADLIMTALAIVRIDADGRQP